MNVKEFLKDKRRIVIPVAGGLAVVVLAACVVIGVQAGHGSLSLATAEDVKAGDSVILKKAGSSSTPAKGSTSSSSSAASSAVTSSAAASSSAASPSVSSQASAQASQQSTPAAAPTTTPKQSGGTTSTTKQGGGTTTTTGGGTPTTTKQSGGTTTTTGGATTTVNPSDPRYAAITQYNELTYGSIAPENKYMAKGTFSKADGVAVGTEFGTGLSPEEIDLKVDIKYHTLTVYVGAQGQTAGDQLTLSLVSSTRGSIFNQSICTITGSTGIVRETISLPTYSAGSAGTWLSPATYTLTCSTQHGELNRGSFPVDERGLE